MSDKVREALEIITAEFAKSAPNAEKIGLIARSIRWQKNFDQEDKSELIEMALRLQENDINDSWIVERTIFEVLCEHAGPKDVAFLEGAFRKRGKHGDDRRRFALQALSGVVAKYNDKKALAVLEKGLSHVKKDTRGWTIGFLMDGFLSQQSRVPNQIVTKLADMMKNDKSPDVRVEASRALADIGFIDAVEMAQVLEDSKAMQKDAH